MAGARLAPALEKLEKDNASLLLYREGRLDACTVGELAAQALRWTRTGSVER